MPDDNAERASHFRQLKWSLLGLATAGGDQQPLFPDQVATADQLAQDFDHWASAVRANYEPDLSDGEAASLDALDRKLATMSRDGVEFDADLWTDAALATSEHWAEVRALALSALEAFGWYVETPPHDPREQRALLVRDGRR